jgi:hypothetical protein
MSFQYSGFGKIAQFALQAGRRNAHAARQLRDVPGFFRLQKRCRQDSLAGLWEQCIEGRHISHLA